GSLKSNRLTVGGIQQIVSAAATEAEVLRPIIGVLDHPAETADRDTIFDRVIGILDAIPTVLAIDNIETIDLGSLRPLLIRIPRQSKVVLTSRIGLGEIDLPYALGPMTEKDSLR